MKHNTRDSKGRFCKKELQEKKNVITAYKVFKHDWTCRGFQYKVGETYTHTGKIKPCKNGFHCCQKLVNCFNYYDFDPRNKVAQVEVWGSVEQTGDKLCASNIKIIKELDWHTVLDLVNTGSSNTGIYNSGDSNTGNWNSGHRNFGFFNTSAQDVIFCFNKPMKGMFIAFPDFLYFDLTEWVCTHRMTDKEKEQHPEHTTTGGFLRVLSYKEAFRKSFEKAKAKANWQQQLAELQAIPNFDANIFYEISGIKPEELV